VTDCSTPLVELRSITKRFGVTVALREANFALASGEIHALLGENGAGKSTLMHLLAGLLRPTSGEMRLAGKPVVFRSPLAAAAAGIAMVHQHFTLAENLTVAENLALARPEAAPFLHPLAPAEEALRLAAEMGWELPADVPVRQLPVGLRQRLEIVKALARRPRILILDEPTAVLTPQETEELFAVLRRLREQGTSIIFISHKLRETLALADRVSVLRRGETVATLPVAEADERALAEWMIGAAPPQPPSERPPVAWDAPAVLCVERLGVRDDRGARAVDGVTLQARAGEILGLAGVDGNGQRELAEAILGLRPAECGRIRHSGFEGPGLHGAGYIPEDRQRQGLALEASVRDNLILELHRLPEYRWGPWLRWRRLDAAAAQLMADYDIRAASPMQAAGSLSGGNQQKIVVARALARQPSFILAVNPTRGLDVGAAEFVHERLRAQRRRGAGVLLISTELEEVLALADRVAVLYSGRIVGEVPPTASPTTLGLLMGGRALNAA